MRRTWAYLLVAFGVLLALAGWYARRGQSGGPGRIADSPRAQRSSMGTYWVSFQPMPDPIPLNQPFTMSVAVYDGADHTKPISDSTVSIDARMPAHNHGMNLEPQVTATGDGTAKVDGMLFHMAGHWELYIDVIRDADVERTTFDVTLQ
jgi:hypothetical protein